MEACDEGIFYLLHLLHFPLLEIFENLSFSTSEIIKKVLKHLEKYFEVFEYLYVLENTYSLTFVHAYNGLAVIASYKVVNTTWIG